VSPTNSDQLDQQLEERVGAALRAWGHLGQAAGVRLPSNLLRANRVRRGALAILAGAKGRRR